MDGMVIVGSRYTDSCYKIKFNTAIDLYVDEELRMMSFNGVPMQDDI